MYFSSVSVGDKHFSLMKSKTAETNGCIKVPIGSNKLSILHSFKGILFLEIGSFYHSPRVKQFGFTVFECIQPIF